MKSQLPNLIVIGAMKSGTTSLHYYLSRHPDIFMSEIKEPHFFMKKQAWKNGIDWYKGLFKTEKPFRGESSQGYTKYHADDGVAERIHNTVPNVKMIYIIRDPIDRVLSHAVEFQIEEASDHFDLKETLVNNPNHFFIKTSLYYKQLSYYLKFFPKEQIHILCLEDLKENRLHEMNKIFKFIGADPIKDESLFHFIKNESSEKTRETNFLKKLKSSYLKRILKKILPRRFFKSLKNSIFINKSLSKKIIKQTLDDDLEKLLTNIFANDVKKLKMLTGREFHKWREY